MKKVLLIMAGFSLFLASTVNVLADDFFTQGVITKIGGKTILLDGETVVGISDKTRIYGKDGKETSMDSFEVNSLVMVKGEGRRREVLAEKILILPIKLGEDGEIIEESPPEEELSEEEEIKALEKFGSLMMEMLPH